MPRPATAVPPLGADFHKLWAAAAVSNVGDGVTMVASPLLIASVTDNPVSVSVAVFAGALPWVLFSLISGVYVDRLDRRRLMVGVGVLRGVAVGGLAVAVLADVAVVPLAYLAFFLLGAGETVTDTAFTSQLPSVVPPERLAGANARLMAAFTIGNQFVAKPLGALLFVVSAALPFGFDAVSFLAAAALVYLTRPVSAAPVQRPRQRVRTEAAEGVRWLFGHPLLRAVAVAMGLGNLVYSAAFAVFVLYARDRLGVTEIGYGFLLTSWAVGGLLGSVLASRLQARFGSAVLLRAGLLVEVVMHLTLAGTTRPFVAAAVLVLFGVHTMVWGVLVVTLRQQLVPDHLLGRVTSVHLLLDAAGVTLGSLLGGLLAGAFELTAPYWIAAGTMLLITASAWRPLRLADAPRPAA